MANDLLFALWYFAPAGAANVMPILAAKIPVISHWDAPLDGGRKWRGKRIFDDHKTWRGMITGVAVGILFLGFQIYLVNRHSWQWLPNEYAEASVLLLGFLLSFGALLGDAVKSLIKRQVGVPAGNSWFPFDQLDYIIGGLILSSLYIQLSLVQYFWIVIVWFGMHILFSYIGYLLKFKQKPI